jgi:hypothetical protein
MLYGPQSNLLTHIFLNIQLSLMFSSSPKTSAAFPLIAMWGAEVAEFPGPQDDAMFHHG